MSDRELFNEARRDLVKSISYFSFAAASQDSLAARNLIFHCEQTLLWMDALYSGKEPVDDIVSPSE